LFPLDADRPAWSNERMSNDARPKTREAEQAEAVLDNPAFQAAMAELRKDVIEAMLTAKTDTDSLLMARLRYDALDSVGSELERILHTRANSRE
jgi:hypothetical protein